MAHPGLKVASQPGVPEKKSPAHLHAGGPVLPRLPAAPNSGEARLLQESLGLVGGDSGSSHSDRRGGGRRADTRQLELRSAPQPSPARLPRGPFKGEMGPAPCRSVKGLPQ